MFHFYTPPENIRKLVENGLIILLSYFFNRVFVVTVGFYDTVANIILDETKFINPLIASVALI